MSEIEREFKEAAKDAIRALPALLVTNTDYVPQLKRRPDQGIDRAAALLAIEHLTLRATAEPGLLREALIAALPEACRGEDICEVHQELIFDGRCEDWDRGVRDAVVSVLFRAALSESGKGETE